MRFQDLIYDDVMNDHPRVYLLDSRLVQHCINIQDWHEWWDAAITADMEDACYA